MGGLFTERDTLSGSGEALLCMHVQCCKKSQRETEIQRERERERETETEGERGGWIKEKRSRGNILNECWQ